MKSTRLVLDAQTPVEWRWTHSPRTPHPAPRTPSASAPAAEGGTGAGTTHSGGTGAGTTQSPPLGRLAMARSISGPSGRTCPAPHQLVVAPAPNASGPLRFVGRSTSSQPLGESRSVEISAICSVGLARRHPPPAGGGLSRPPPQAGAAPGSCPSRCTAERPLRRRRRGAHRPGGSDRSEDPSEPGRGGRALRGAAGRAGRGSIRREPGRRGSKVVRYRRTCACRGGEPTTGRGSGPRWRGAPRRR